MPRPMKCRIITEMPNHLAFKPVGTPMEELERVVLTLDEYEALRLADFEELYQEDAAEKMNVSRQTFGNIVKSARKKIAEALVTGKAICIEGGDVTILNKPCPRCKKIENHVQNARIEMMKITCLVNNFSINESLKDEHGLSFYIEKGNKKILFDTGMGEALFHNARELNIDLKDIDYVVLSHGHNDHTGGLIEFLEINKKAKVIAHKEIFIEKFSKRTGEMKFIGLSKNDLDLNRFEFIKENFKLDEDITFVGNLADYEEARGKNHFVKIEEDYVPDISKDEIYMIIKEKSYDILVSGCSHRGIINIINELQEKNYLWERFFLFGGLHFRSKTYEELIKLNQELENLGVKRAFVNHCTFDNSNISKELQTMEYFFGGDVVELGGN